MSLVSLALPMLCILFFSMSLHAQTSQDAIAEDIAPQTQALKTVKVLRLGNLDVPWPEIEINAESAFESEAQFNQLSPSDKATAILNYCAETSKVYAAKAKTLLQIKIPNDYFLYSCDSLAYRLKTGDYVKNFEHVKKINPFILNQLDTSFSYIYNQPHYSFWKTGEEYISSYKNSIFGTLGLPMKYNFIIMQLSLLLAVGLSAVAVFKR